MVGCWFWLFFFFLRNMFFIPLLFSPFCLVTRCLAYAMHFELVFSTRQHFIILIQEKNLNPWKRPQRVWVRMCGTTSFGLLPVCLLTFGLLPSWSTALLCSLANVPVCHPVLFVWLVVYKLLSALQSHMHAHCDTDTPALTILIRPGC